MPDTYESRAVNALQRSASTRERLKSGNKAHALDGGIGLQFHILNQWPTPVGDSLEICARSTSS